MEGGRVGARREGARGREGASGWEGARVDVREVAMM